MLGVYVMCVCRISNLDIYTPQWSKLCMENNEGPLRWAVDMDAGTSVAIAGPLPPPPPRDWVIAAEPPVVFG